MATAEENKAIVRRLYEELNKGNLDIANELIVENYAQHSIFPCCRGEIVFFTHRGEFMGVPPTGKQMKMTGIDIFRLSNGKIVEHWDEVDQLGLLQQLGITPTPEKIGK